MKNAKIIYFHLISSGELSVVEHGGTNFRSETNCEVLLNLDSV